MRSIKAVLFILLFSTLPMLVHADCFDLQEHVLGKQYEIEIYSNTFNLSFDVRSLTECPRGTATLSYMLEQDGWTKEQVIEFDFTTNDTDGFVTIEYLGYVFFGSNKLYLMPMDIPMIVMKKISPIIIFPWPGE